MRLATPAGEVGAEVLGLSGARCVLVLAHGAGAGMQHPFMQDVASGLAARRVGTLRFQFPYIEQGRRRPDPERVLLGTVQAAVVEGARVAGDLPLFAGGKSMGGRMTSMAVSKGLLTGVRGLVFLGFPLHAPRAPTEQRAAHLVHIPLPMLFVQGTRDALADLALMKPVCARLRPLAHLHVVDGADHGFAVPKRSGRTRTEVIAHLADVVAAWCHSIAVDPGPQV